MKNLHPFIRAHLVFLVIAVPILFLPKGKFLLWLNDLHTPFWDSFFKYATYLGDGIIPAVLIVLLLFVNYYRTLVFTAAILLETLIVQGVGKRGFFSHLVRPKKFFGEDVALNFVEGVNVHGYHTFPSGHTAVAFVLFCFLALSINRKWGIPLFLIALIVGISRVYILQHFFIDIYFGALIGTASVLIIQYFFQQRTNISQNPAWHKGLLGERLKL
ncbi:MAG: phosphatase PAP2 family protein [Bacteroidales bacterium]|nr:phosphatase PAP2 family protein [Bacteroidales bacterium]MCF8334684.1 phosphatase PAP2 family protein [Bacteroidales bacterium]